MKLFVFPLTTTQSVFYCHRTAHTALARSKPRLDEKFIQKAAETWKNWESSSVTWQKKTVQAGNYFLEKIPYNEWSFRSVPSMSTIHRRKDLSAAISSLSLTPSTSPDTLITSSSSPEVQLVTLPAVSYEAVTVEKLQPTDLVPIPLAYPSSLLTSTQIANHFGSLARQSIGLYKKNCLWTLLLSPLTLPLALLPVMPNLPGIYLLFRSFANFKAMQGAQHLDYLINDNHVDYCPEPIIDRSYQNQKQAVTNSNEAVKEKESVLLDVDTIDPMLEELGIPEFSPELHRALRQAIESVTKLNSSP
ncbi:hypothetical protein NADFUDRAFT_82718 [Nadsonia fulvescens var. elongata DSM 6958]|uniref:Mitochondrial K+-H+ exchange-related-domain-containing protein n=1 Tax=Nadsonia fulvescens var. elongata DSM 6958 TaxID=857566 RepID=A0A1E3PJY6_9ASCO|nr:hypothetical protein NADFUDRAFT_82718 [Nadsonia fulvescens var. elongata DSM 6958]